VPIKSNASYQPLTTVELLKLDYWVHHRPQILKQGRVSYFDGNKLIKQEVSSVVAAVDVEQSGGGETMLSDTEDDDFDDDVDGAEEEATNSRRMKPEIPIPLFASCSGDRLTNDAISPWTIKLKLNDVDSLVMVQSSRWPGAFTLAKERYAT